MIDSFSSACDSVRNFFRRRWYWIVGALALYFLFGNWIASVFGYAETVTETVIENDKSVIKKTTSWLSPGARLLRDSFIAIAAILGIVMAGWRNFALDRQSKAALKQAEIGNLQAQHDRDRIASEQFSDAVKLLTQKDAKNNPAIDARIGGIYSLQTLANNRVAEYGAQVVKTLISYIKQNAQLTAQPPLKKNETPTEARALGEDVKTAFNVLEQLLTEHKKDSVKSDKPLTGIELSDQDLSFSSQNFSWLDLSVGQVGGLHRYIWSRVNLQGANLARAQLKNARLTRAQLQGANLYGAQLQGAELLSAELQGAELSRAQLKDANLSWAQLKDANLSWAQLQGAALSGAQLQGAKLSGASLQGAKLSVAEMQGAKLLRARLQGAQLSGARLQGAKLSEAELQYTDLSMARLGDAILPSDLSGKIWHSGQPELSEIASLSPDAKWDLSPFLHSGYALAGVLRNFAFPDGIVTLATSEYAMRAKKLRMAVCVLDKKKLPEDFPQDWRDWLDGIEPDDNSHPNDSGRLG